MTGEGLRERSMHESPAAPPPDPSRGEDDATGYVSLKLDEAWTSATPFLVGGQREGRVGGAMGVSIVTHLAIIGAVLLFLRFSPSVTDALPDVRNLGIVWLPIEGPGGGGGGGNQSPEPPRKAQTPGREKIAVPTERPPDIKTPQLDAPEPQEVKLTIPAVAQNAGELNLPGTLDGLSAPDSSSTGSGRGTGAGPGSGSGLGPGSGGGTGGGVFRPGAGIQIPKPIKEVKPQYTAEAMRAKIQGEVWLEAVVMPDGSVGQVSVVRSLDSSFGLDLEAIKAARQWRFQPGTRFGQPVPILVTISMTFTLR